MLQLSSGHAPLQKNGGSGHVKADLSNTTVYSAVQVMLTSLIHMKMLLHDNKSVYGKAQLQHDQTMSVAMSAKQCGLLVTTRVLFLCSYSICFYTEVKCKEL